MKIKDIETSTMVSDIRVRLPQPVYDLANTYGDFPSKDMYIAGPMMGDWFVKVGPRDAKLYPLFREHIPWEELKEWEVLEIQ